MRDGGLWDSPFRPIACELTRDEFWLSSSPKFFLLKFLAASKRFIREKDPNPV